eukprot:SAG31_NODE_1637_length_7679_cov_5.133509_3_plen_85_part_00
MSSYRIGTDTFTLACSHTAVAAVEHARVQGWVRDVENALRAEAVQGCAASCQTHVMMLTAYWVKNLSGLLQGASPRLSDHGNEG